MVFGIGAVFRIWESVIGIWDRWCIWYLSWIFGSNALFGICESVFVIEDGSFLYLEELSLHLFMNQSLPLLPAAKQIGWGKNNPIIFLMLLENFLNLRFGLL